MSRKFFYILKNKKKELQIRIEAANAQGRPLNEKAYAGMRNKISEEVSLESQEFILEDIVCRFH